MNGRRKTFSRNGKKCKNNTMRTGEDKNKKTFRSDLGLSFDRGDFGRMIGSVAPAAVVAVVVD
jgi:hypothetical protein